MLSAVIRSNSFLQVTKLQIQHNHELDPNISRFMQAYKSVRSTIKRRLEAHDIAEIKLSKSIILLEVQVEDLVELS